MKKYLTEYRKHFRALIDSGCDLKALLAYHEKQIEFFQHERLVHLIVTVLFATAEIITIIAAAVIHGLAVIILAIAILCLLIPYISHYYFLENQVQYMYDDFNELFERIYGFSYRSDTEGKKKCRG